jgi:hypothetical protein
MNMCLAVCLWIPGCLWVGRSFPVCVCVCVCVRACVRVGVWVRGCVGARARARLGTRP